MGSVKTYMEEDKIDLGRDKIDLRWRTWCSGCIGNAMIILLASALAKGISAAYYAWPTIDQYSIPLMLWKAFLLLF